MDRQHYRWAFFIIVFLLASVYFFVFSESGLLERIALDKEKHTIAAHIEALKSENKGLQRLLDSYRRGIYPEGEIADSGYIRNGGSVLVIREQGKETAVKKPVKAGQDEFPVALSYMRIMWIVISAAVVIALILFGRKFTGEAR